MFPSETSHKYISSNRACLGDLKRVGTWHERWKTLGHLSQHSSSPPVWHAAHKTSLESSSGAWCWSTCCSPPSEQMWFGALVSLWSRGLLRGCDGLQGLSSVFWRGVGISFPSPWALIWGWSPVLSGRLALWLACTWNPETERKNWKYCNRYVLMYFDLQYLPQFFVQ